MGSKSPSYQQVPSFSSATTTPNPQAGAAYSSTLNRAANVASTPYQAYGGQLVAGFSPLQQQSFGQVQGLQGYTQPYTEAATGATLGALSSMAPQNYGNTVQQYMNPYQQNVVDATMAQLRNQQGQQQNDLTSQNILGGGMGGDRGAVARAALTGQQNLATGSTISGLEQAGYQNAQQQALASANLGLSGGAQLSALGQQGLAGNLTSTNALNAAGAQQQQLNQQQLQTAYQQWQLAQQFPYAQTQWLAGVQQGVGPLMGGNTSGFQTTPVQQPSGAGQIAGGLTAGAGLLGSMFGLKDGGRVPYADGGGDLSSLYGGGGGGLYGLPIAPVSAERADFPSISFSHPVIPEKGKFDPAAAGKALSGLFKKGKSLLSDDGTSHPLVPGAYGPEAPDSTSPTASPASSPTFADVPLPPTRPTSFGVSPAASMTVPPSVSGPIAGVGSLGRHEFVLPQGYRPIAGGQNFTEAPANPFSGVGNWFGSAFGNPKQGLVPDDYMPSIDHGPSLADGGRVHFLLGGYGDGPPDRLDPEEAFKQTAKFEGGYSNDSGGPTMYGISSKAHPGLDVSSLTPERAKDMYKSEYWDAIGAGDLPAHWRV